MNHICNILIELSFLSNMRCRHSAAILKGKKIISTGFSHQRGCINGKSCSSMHAEYHAIHNRKSYKGYSIIIIRSDNNGNLLNSYPCNECLYYIRRSGIKKVYFSDDNGKIYCMRTKDMIYKHISLGKRQTK